MSTATLTSGHPIHLSDGSKAGTIVRFLGSGGQGEVYEAQLNAAPLAFKRYHASVVQNDVRLKERLAKAIANGSPDKRFLWPLSFASAEGDQKGIGILMPLREPRFRSMKDLIVAPPKRVSPSLAARATACLRIADSFLHLHSCGLCYQDISFGNLFLDPLTGDIAICDNDNVDVNGAPPSVFGTRKFMAPEIVRREAMPSAQTDLYSMTVMFFYLLFAWHPLDGKIEAETMILDGEAELALYGTAPRFLFDPVDASNGPVSGMHDPIVRRWRALSPELRRLFVRSFTSGLVDPAKRVLETEWRDAFLRLRNTLIKCEACGFEHALSSDDSDAMPDKIGCIACKGAIDIPLLLAVGRSKVALLPGTSITAAHIDPLQRFDEEAAALALVETHPSNTSVLGLRNLGTANWHAKFADGREVNVAPGTTLRIVKGAQIAFSAGSTAIVSSYNEVLA